MEDLYSKLYDEMDEYVNIRIINSAERKKYELEVEHFKLKYLSELVKNLEAHSLVEIGCAVGILLNRFPINVPFERRTGIDLSKINIDYCKTNYPEMDFYCGTLSQFKKEFPERTFTISILSDILEHVEDDVKLLKDSASISDFVVLNLPLEKCEEFKNRVYGLNDYHGHLRAYSKSDAQRLIKDANLIEVSHIEKRYVQEPVFRSYLANKLMNSGPEETKCLGVIKYINELNHIDLYPEFYKSNYFTLLKKEN